MDLLVDKYQLASPLSTRTHIYISLPSLLTYSLGLFCLFKQTINIRIQVQT